jgi:hypothetical protein
MAEELRRRRRQPPLGSLRPKPCGQTDSCRYVLLQAQAEQRTNPSQCEEVDVLDKVLVERAERGVALSANVVRQCEGAPEGSLHHVLSRALRVLGTAEDARGHVAS